MKRWILLLLCLMLCGCQSVQEETAEKPQNGIAEAATEPGAPRGSLLFNLTVQALGTGMTYLANVPGADKLTSPALDALDIAGYNYAQARYGRDARKHPDRIIV